MSGGEQVTGWQSRMLAELRVTAPGIAAATIGVPAVIRQWMPLRFAIAWAVSYVIVSIGFIWLQAIKTRAAIGDWWNAATGLLFAVPPLSVLVWTDGNPAAPWLAGVVAMCYIAFEVATLPYAPVRLWWAGVTITGSGVLVMAVFRAQLLVTGAFTLVMIAMILAAEGARREKLALDARLIETEAMIRTDPLTGVLNRRGLEDRLQVTSSGWVTVAVFDIDRFKRINDLYGHEVGDHVLQAVARHLAESLDGDQWTIGRLGGDEFVVLCNGEVEVPHNCLGPLSVVAKTASSRVRLDVSLSMGVASNQMDGRGDRLLSEAGHALRHAKRTGDRSARSGGLLRDQFERSVDVATIDCVDSPVVPVAQPIVAEGRVVGCELLARWSSSSGQLLPPSHFMQMLAENGLLGELDDLMIRHAVATLASLRTIDAQMLVSVNMSPMRLLDRDLAGRLAALIEEFDVDPSGLMIEITEVERLGAETHWGAAVRQLRDIGFSIAIDDFGSGYSNIERLSRLPITHLKLDRSIVENGELPLMEIVRGITRFCAAKGIAVIAEGIETPLELGRMQRAEVGIFQGFLFGRPTCLDLFSAQLAAGRIATVGESLDGDTDGLGREAGGLELPINR